ncbi:MAG TPA: hypothetical protein VGL38_09540 [bacterium]|jgi:hypothetical protein
MPKYTAFFQPFGIRVDFKSACKKPGDVTEDEAQKALQHFLKRSPKDYLVDLIVGQVKLDRIEADERCPACGHSTALCICQRVED